MDQKAAASLAKALVVMGMRNTSLEDIHAGITPDTETEDFSDVKVVTPYGDIPWHQLSRISDEEMKALMQESVNKVYTILRRLEDPDFMARMLKMSEMMTCSWDEPEELTDWNNGDLKKPL